MSPYDGRSAPSWLLSLHHENSSVCVSVSVSVFVSVSASASVLVSACMCLCVCLCAVPLIFASFVPVARDDDSRGSPSYSPYRPERRSSSPERWVREVLVLALSSAYFQRCLRENGMCAAAGVAVGGVLPLLRFMCFVAARKRRGQQTTMHATNDVGLAHPGAWVGLCSTS